jgi:hypothetical protein
MINPLAGNRFWVVPSRKKLSGLMRLFVLVVGIALTWPATPSLLSPIWDVPERFARTGIVLSAFKRRSKLALWIAFTGLPLMTSRAYKRSLILRSFFRSGCPLLLAHDGFSPGSRKTELR